MNTLLRSSLIAALIVPTPACIALGQRPGRGDRLVDVELTTLEGEKTQLLQLINGRVAVFEFGATWCGWCTRQLAEFNTVARRYANDTVAVFDIDVNEGARVVAAHAKAHKVAFQTVLDPNGRAAGRYNVSGIPVTIVAAPDGTILYRGYYTPFDRLNRIIAPAARQLEAERRKRRK